MSIPFYPFLIGAYPLLFLYGQNAGVTPLSSLGVSLFISGVLCALVWLFAATVLNSRDKQALVAALGTLLLTAHGFIRETVLSYAWTVFPSGELGKRLRGLDLNIEVALLELLVVLIVILLLRKISLSLQTLTKAFNTFAICLCALAVLPALTSNEKTSSEPAPKATTVTSNRPDIYHIILDGYGRGDILEQHYQYSNAEFESWLEARDFNVLAKSTSNYVWTYLSLASTLNMKYLDDLPERLKKNPKNLTVPYRMIKHNALSKFLRDNGYSHYHLQSTFAPTMHNPAADRNIRCGGFIFHDEFLRVAASYSMLAVVPEIFSSDLAACHLGNFKQLALLASEQSPKYVFAHFILPHHPYLFDAEGNVLKHATVSNQFDFQKKLWGDKKSYIEQLKFLNKKMKEVVTALIEKSASDPIIVIHSDHGVTLLDANPEDTQEARFGNLTAIRIPGGLGQIPQDLSQVNIFRYILFSEFQQDLALLPNRHFYSGFHTPLNFEERVLEPRG